jgi:hypothetical protein
LSYPFNGVQNILAVAHLQKTDALEQSQIFGSEFEHFFLAGFESLVDHLASALGQSQLPL